MLYRNTLIFLSLAVLLVKADFDLDQGSQNSQAMSTDQDSTSDEVPTESMNSISSDQPKDESYYFNGGAKDVSSISSESDVSEPLPSNEINEDGTNSSIEDQDEDRNSSIDDDTGKR
ncbi:uncharacterized protein [Lepisosteus oculatus]|uniref:uncharacterized protein isoform X1 n=1 Tax=Lepisosteus oculatus TaxID=7918 RepID=UPI0035F5227B